MSSFLVLQNVNSLPDSYGKPVGALSPVNHKGPHQAEHKTSLHPQAIHFTSHHTTSHVFLFFFYPIYIPWTLNTGTCLQQGDLIYSVGLHRNHVLATANTGEIGRGFGKKSRVNGPEG